jgi:hypothetical protein
VTKYGKAKATAERVDGESADTAGTSSELAKPISFADVILMTHKQASEPDALLQALRASPEHTRRV